MHLNELKHAVIVKEDKIIHAVKTITDSSVKNLVER